MEIEFKETSARSSGSDRLVNRLRQHRLAQTRFAASEDGSLIVLSLVLFMLMVTMGGLAVDVMRFEQRRTALQQTLDRSVLAAASMTQNLEPADVVNDYFQKAGLAENLDWVDVDRGINYRIVTAGASSNLATLFISNFKFLEESDVDINNLAVAAASGAEQRISNVEVSMVLDISGSMGGSRINNLRPAAREFVTSVLSTAEPGRVSISIVPYNAQVNIGAQMLSAFNVNTTNTHSASACIELPDSTFTSNTMSRTAPFTHNAHFDPYNYTSGWNNMLFNCPPNTGNGQVPMVQNGNTVTPMTDNQGVLHAAINNLAVGGNTSIDVGVKWGAYLLSRSANPVIQHLVNQNRVQSKFGNRPLDPATADVLKVLVVMTDGENTTEYKINDPYNTGDSNIYEHRTNGRVSVYFNRSGSNDWWWPRTNTWNSGRDGGGSNSNYNQLTWPQVWANYSVTYVAYHFYGLALNQNYNNWRDTFMTQVYWNKDTRLQQICNAAKSDNIIVYGIGFEAPTNGRDQVRACATSNAHYFDARGLEISSAFRAIANNISQLRLTQ
ncbi:pilus assembly protein [Pseudorhodobacter ferrugineus]|uniref:pilus assembly protein n=1 Tax=Pseudorhodobacter ferrugineus TaxID=77008 RepID=UPI0003B603AC|nr:Tad domain-containing protein [Pseudorhodobacter ferrugineus]